MRDACAKADNGQIILLENLRFHPEEERMTAPTTSKISVTKEQYTRFSEELSSLGDVFINDAFPCVHRTHSSVIGMNHEIKAPGLLMEKELYHFDKLLNKPKKPVLSKLNQ